MIYNNVLVGEKSHETSLDFNPKKRASVVCVRACARACDATECQITQLIRLYIEYAPKAGLVLIDNLGNEDQIATLRPGVASTK